MGKMTGTILSHTRTHTDTHTHTHTHTPPDTRSSHFLLGPSRPRSTAQRSRLSAGYNQEYGFLAAKGLPRESAPQVAVGLSVLPSPRPRRPYVAARIQNDADLARRRLCQDMSQAVVTTRHKGEPVIGSVKCHLLTTPFGCHHSGLLRSRGTRPRRAAPSQVSSHPQPHAPGPSQRTPSNAMNLPVQEYTTSTLLERRFRRRVAHRTRPAPSGCVGTKRDLPVLVCAEEGLQQTRARHEREHNPEPCSVHCRSLSFTGARHQTRSRRRNCR